MPGCIRLIAAAMALHCVVAVERAHAGCAAEPFVSNAASAIIGAARKKSPAAFSGVASRYADMRALAFFALGKHRGSLPKALEDEYVALTGRFVGRFMARHSSRFDARHFEISQCTISGKSAIVAVRLSRGQKVIFKLYRTRGGYRVRDMSVSSVWLAQQLRSAFAGVIRREGGVSGLIRYLRG